MDPFASHRAAENVRDLATFIEFLEALSKDWQAATAAERRAPSSPYSSMYGWENTDIGDFLEAAIAGAKDNKLSNSGGVAEEANAWRQAAEIILLGKIYE